MIISGGIIFLLVAYAAISKLVNIGWLKKPSDEGKFLDCKGKRMFYRVKGKGDPAVVIINTYGSSSIEWWPVQNELEAHSKIISFERPGYGWSTASSINGKASDVSDEIDLILKFERIKKPVILAANGFASIYARHYACTRPQNVAGVVLINPVPVDYKHWMATLSEFEEYKPPEKKAASRMTLARLGFYRLFSPFKRFFRDLRYVTDMTEFYNSSSSYATMVKELSSIQESIEELRTANPFPAIPLKIVFSGEEPLIREWVRYGVPEYTARQICRQYRIFSMDNLYLSQKSDIVEIEGEGELIHLGKPREIASQIASMLKHH
jgi:pimeloyl-ACP methyl ester carboxylesterase